MIRAGLTGGIAAGKSTVGEMFVALGAHLIQADHIAHDLMQPGQAVYQEVVRHFGAGILDPDGRVNRPRLAEAAFGPMGENAGVYGSRIQELNRIVHPAVIRRQEEWLDEMARQHSGSVAIVEAALLLEAGAGETLDRLIVVTCQPEQRIQRWAERLHVDAETARKEVIRRMAAQWPDERKIKAADYVIDNSGSLDQTRRQAQKVFAELKKQAEAKEK